MVTGESSICEPQPLGLATSEVLDSIRHQAPSVERADNPSIEATGHPPGKSLGKPSGEQPTSGRDKPTSNPSGKPLTGGKKERSDEQANEQPSGKLSKEPCVRSEE